LKRRPPIFGFGFVLAALRCARTGSTLRCGARQSLAKTQNWAGGFSVQRSDESYSVRRGRARRFRRIFVRGLRAARQRAQARFSRMKREFLGVSPADLPGEVQSAGSPRVAVIGAGTCGIATAKALADAGISFQCFEKGDRVGGNWLFKNKNGLSSAYRSLHINTSRERMQFRDFPMPRDYPDYPRHDLIARYFESYAQAFDLHRHIRFETTVEHARPRAEGGFRLTLGNGAVEEFDALIVANGHHWDPAWPEPPIPGTFSGLEFHSHAYVDPDEPHALRGKRVLVVGMGNSAMDIACELGHPGVAERVFLCARRGAWVLPKYAFGKPIDQNSALPAFLPASLKRALAELWYRVVVGRPEDFGLPKPEHHLDQAHPTLSDEILARLGSGDVSAKPALVRKDGRSAHFSDGSREELDAIIYATGYNVRLPFFEPGLVPLKGNDLPLFMRIFPFDRQDLCFIGLAQPVGAVMPLAEAQAKLVAEMLSGQYDLPDGDQRRERAERERAAMFARYVPSRRHTMQLDFEQYMADLAAEARAGRRRAKHRAARSPRAPRPTEPARHS
jgi:dimethylaniline monooxygenase (N-oxide forming)